MKRGERRGEEKRVEEKRREDRPKEERTGEQRENTHLSRKRVIPKVRRGEE